MRWESGRIALSIAGRQGCGQPRPCLPILARKTASATTHLLELSEVQRLVGAVGAGVGVLDTGDDDRGLGEALDEAGDEGDRATDPDVDRIGAPGVREGGAGLVVGGTVGLGREAGAALLQADLDAGPPRGVALEMGLHELEGGSRVLRRRQAHRHLRGGRGGEGVGRLVDGRDVHADRRDGRLGPEPGEDRAGADEVDAVEQAALLSEPGLVVVELGRLTRVEAGDGDGARVVVQAGEQPHERGDGVDRDTAVHPGVHRVVEGAHADDEPHAHRATSWSGPAHRWPSCWSPR